MSGIDRALAVALVGGIGTMLMWGVSDVISKRTVDENGFVKTLFYVMAFGILPILLLLVISATVPTIAVSDFLIVFILSFIEFLGYYFFYRALSVGNVSLVSPISSVYIVLNVLISAMYFHEPLGIGIIIPIVIIIIGVLLLSMQIGKISSDTNGTVSFLSSGLKEAFASLLCFGIFYPFWDFYVSNRSWMISLFYLRLSMACIAGIFYVAGLKKRVLHYYRFPKKWLPFLWIGTFDIFAYVFLSWSYSTSTLTSITTALSAAYSAPTAILAWIFLRESIGRRHWIGIGCILVGIILFSWIA